MGDDDFYISRDCEKYVKRLKGEETTEAAPSASFTSFRSKVGETESLNGLTEARQIKISEKCLEL